MDSVVVAVAVHSENCSPSVTRLEYNAWACVRVRKEERGNVKGLRCLWQGPEFGQQSESLQQEVEPLVEAEPSKGKSKGRRPYQDNTGLFQVSQGGKSEESSLRSWSTGSDTEDTSESPSGRS